MSVDSKKIIIYSSPQPEHVMAPPTAASSTTMSTTRRRTVYRVRITNPQDLEVLTAAAKLRLASWVGGQKVRIVGVDQKQSKESHAQRSLQHSALSCSPSDVRNPRAAVSVASDRYVAENELASCVLNGSTEVYASGANGKPPHPAASPSSMFKCDLSSHNSVPAVSMCSTRETPSCVVSLAQPAATSCRSDSSASTIVTVKRQMFGGHASNGLSHASGHSGAVLPVQSSVCYGLPRGVRYLGTVAVNSKNGHCAGLPRIPGPSADIRHHHEHDVPLNSKSSTGLNSVQFQRPQNGFQGITLAQKSISSSQLLPSNASTAILREIPVPRPNQQCHVSSSNAVSVEMSASSLKRPCFGSDSYYTVPAKRARTIAEDLTAPSSTEVRNRYISVTDSLPLAQSTVNGLCTTQITNDVLRRKQVAPVSCDSQPVSFNSSQNSELRKLPTSYRDFRLNYRYPLSTFTARFRQPAPPAFNVSNSQRLNVPYLPSNNNQLEQAVDVTETCARSRRFRSTKKKHCFFTFLLSSQTSVDSFDVNCNYRRRQYELPMAMRFRQLREFGRETVTVRRSRIHGLGVFCIRNVDAGDMLMEYAGEVIRSSVADVRERRYEALGIGCYMFRCGEDDVIDATKCGNIARFINHSCEPNSYSRQIVIDGRIHIVIFALRDIDCGEELTYDYKFPIEDVKMPCYCRARRCRRYLN